MKFVPMLSPPHRLHTNPPAQSMRALKVRVDELGKIYVDKMMTARPKCDFVRG
jgi:hypothetical protein